MVRRCLSVVMCGLGGVLAGPLAAQNPPPPTPEPTIHTTATEVALDLVVRDKKGRLVKNLQPGDVQIYEDGVRQQIRSFRLVPGGEAAPAAAQPGGAPTRPSPISLPAINLICIVFQNLSPATRKWAVDAAQEFIKKELPPDAWVGVFNLDARLKPLHAFTTNRAELLRAAAGAFNGTAVDLTQAAQAVLNSTPNVQLYVGFVGPGGTSGGVEDLSTTGSVSMAAITGADVDNGPGANAQRGDLVIQREQFIGIEGAREMDQIRLMIRQLGLYPGHKTVLLFSAGLTGTGDPDRFQAMLDKANQQDMSIYAFDTNGLSETSSAQASTMAMEHVTALSRQQAQMAPGEASPNTTAIGSAGAMMERIRQGEYARDAVRTSDPQAGLRALAEGTGGFLVANTNDVDKPFQQIVGEAETHYEADYHPSADKYDGRFRKIEVKLERAGLTAECRRGYFAMPDLGEPRALKPYEMAGLITLNSRPLPHAFPFRSEAFQFRPGSTSSQSAVVFELPASDLKATPEPARGSHRLHASLFAVVKDANGQIVDKYSGDFPYLVPDNRLAGILAAPIDYTHLFYLAPGRYTVESVLFDREANRASTSSIALDVPQRKGIGLSSIVLVRRADRLTAAPPENDPLLFDGREVIPQLSGALPASAKPLAYFLVYPDKSNPEKARIRVEFSVDGKLMEQKEADLPAPDASGAVPMLVNTVARPGKCELRVTVFQGINSAAQSVSYTIAGK